MAVSAAQSAAAATQAVNSGSYTTAGVANTAAAPGSEIKSDPNSTAPKFGDVLNQIQAKYGAKAEKPREIKKTLGKDDFLRIMITQMKHQDPTSPFKPEQMAAEMAQFASVEQLQNMNQNLGKMMNQNQPLERLAMVNMIGKTVTVDRERFPHSEGSNEALSFTLPRDATDVKVAVISSEGEVVFEKDLGAQKKGEGSFVWDGTKKNTLPAKSGTYMLRVEARDPSNNLIETNPQRTARVVGVSFEGNEPVFLVGDAIRQDKVTMRNIVRIDDANGMPVGGGAAGAVAGAAPQAPKNFISFQKGVGSGNIDPSQLPPEAREALEKFQAQAAEMSKEGNSSPAQAQAPAQVQSPAQPNMAAAMNPQIQQALAQVQGGAPAQVQQPQAARPSAQQFIDGEKGFPNGLQDNDNNGSMKKGGEKR